ncbi:MAG: protein kinase [Planctomycetota bacterium]|nr:protein kinase [Planctomycetota bacterium]
MAQSLICTCGHPWTPLTMHSSGTLPLPFCPVCGRSRTPPTEEPAEQAATLDGDTEISGNLPVAFAGQLPPARLPEIPGYQVQGELGHGGMGVVYQAYDLRYGRTVALKTLPNINPAALQRFKQEFRSRADLTHPNLATCYELVSDGRTWFFSMELVDGVDFLHYVRGDSGETAAAGTTASDSTPLDVSRLRSGLVQLSQGLNVLHEAGVIHRDVKPANILVTRAGRVVLLDFGLAAELEQGGQYQSADDNIVGTVCYMSPEQAASEPLSPAGDWYSLGVILYEALTGRAPFTGKPIEVLLAKQQGEPPRPREVSPAVPADLDELCVALLRRNPADRPGGSEVLRRLQLVTAGAGAQACSSARVPSPERRRLMGREQHLAQLESWAAEVEGGLPVTIFVRGRSGMGKSALVQKFLERLCPGGQAVILTGRCYEQESVPFKALDSLIDALARYLHRLPRAEVEAFIPHDWAALTGVFPVLGRIEAVAGGLRRAVPLRDQQELRRRASSALRELLARIGDRRLLVLFIDDLQWGDEDSAALLSSLLKPPDPPLMLLLGTYRAEDELTSVFLRTIGEAQRKGELCWEHRALSVEPLTPEEAQRLALTLLGGAAGDVARQAERVAQESGGSPFFVQELVRHLASLERPERSGEINLEEVLWTRVLKLPEPARQLLEVIAVAGHAIPARDVFRAAALETDGPTWLGQLRNAHFVRSTDTDGELQVEAYHDRIREAVGSHLDRDQLGELHRRLAETLETSLPVNCRDLSERFLRSRPNTRATVCAELTPRDWQRIFQVARHYDAADAVDRAWPFALLAAEQARAQYSLETAEQQFRIAERGVPPTEHAVVYHIAMALGGVLMLRGRYEQAQGRFQTARRLAEGDLARAEAEGHLGELAFKQGDMKNASVALERAMNWLGRRTPCSTLATLPVFLWEGTVQILHTLLPRWFLARRSLEGAEQELLAMRLLSRLAHTYWFERSKLATLTVHLRCMNLAELYPPTQQLAQVYSEHAPVMSLLPWFGRALAYGEKSWQVYRHLEDVWGQAHALHFHGIALYAASRFEDCIKKCREAIRLFEQTGDYWEINMARYQLAASLYRLGRLREAADEARKIHLSGRELGDVQASGLGLDIWSKATLGQLPAEPIQSQLKQLRGDDAQTASQVWQAAGVRQWSQGAYQTAAQTFQQAYELARRAGIKNTYIVPSLLWLATALRCHAELVAERDPADARRCWRQAWWAAQRGLRLARRFQNDLPHALREAGLLAAQRGRTRSARRLLDESLQVAERQAARYEYALTLRARGELGQRLGWLDAAAQLATACEAIRALENSAPGGP